MTTTMLGSYDDESGIGLEERCLKFNMHWDGYPLKSKFNAKLVQYPNELIPRFYIKKEIFERDMMPSWAIRKIAVFNFQFIITSYIDEFLGEVIEDDPREPGMTCFRISYFKVREGAGSFFYPLKAGKYGGTDVGLEDDNRMGLDKYSFNSEVGLIHYTEYPGNLVWEFYFGFDEPSQIYSLSEEDNPIIRLRNSLYMSKYTFTTGTIESIVQEVTFTPLITPLEEISIYTKIFPTWIQTYNTQGGGAVLDEEQLIIPAGSRETYQYGFKPLDTVVNGTLPIWVQSEDLLYKTYNERIKIIAGRTFYIVNVRTGIDPDIYILYFNIFDFKVVNDYDMTLATLELGGSTTFYIKTLPENIDVINLIDPNITIYFTFQNINPHLLYVPETIAWPKRDILGNRLEPTFVTRSYGIASEIDEFEIKISTVSDNFYWNRIAQIPSIQVNIANIYITNNKVLLNIADYTNPVYSSEVQVRPKRYEDVTENLVLAPNVTVSSADFITFNYKAVYENNRFILTEVESEAVTQLSFDYTTPITLKQGDTLYIDTSDPSNFGQKITFYDGNQNYSQELKNEDGGILAEYSRNFAQGTENSYVSIRLPRDRNIVYYRNQPYNPRQAYWQYGFGRINASTLELKSIGDITFTDIDGTPQGGIMTLTSNDVQGQVDVQMGIADNELFADTNLGIITIRTIKVSPPINAVFDVQNDTQVFLNWNVEEIGKTVYDFANPSLTRYVTTVTYEISRLTYESGEPVYEIIGTSDKAEFVDTTAIRYGNYRYKIRSVITWEGVTVRSAQSEFLFVFVCQNNQFPYGRFNNTTQNPRLYKNISQTCNDIGMTTRFPLAGNLFPNSATLTKAQVYSMMSKSRAATR